MADKVLIRRSGHQELDELDATDIPALAYDTVGAAATAASGAASALATHDADTTSVHGIANTANLYVAGGTDVAVADGGTGASTAAGARTNLGLGTAAVAATGDFDAAGAAAAAQAASQPVDATLTALAGLATGANKLPYSTGTDTFSQADLSAFIRTLLDDADAATARATLGVTGGATASADLIYLIANFR